MREDYSSCPVCLFVCVSVASILPSHAFRCPTRGISSYSAENAVKLKKTLSLKLLGSNVRSVLTYWDQVSHFLFTCNVSVYLSVTRT